MNPTWIRAIVLICIFAAVVLAVEVVVRWLASNRAGEKAVSLRMRMIGSGRSRGDTMQALRRTSSELPQGLPPTIDRWARKLERTLMQAQVTIPTPRLMLMVLLAPVALFFLLILFMAASHMAIGFG